MSAAPPLREERPRTEFVAAAIAIAFGVAAVVAMTSRDEYFFGQFVYAWGPQGVILLMVLLFGPRGAAIAGVSIALSLYLVGFWLWERTVGNASGLAWLGYFLSLPGGAIGAVGCAIYFRRRAVRAGGMCVGLICVLATAAGIAVNQVLVCSSVLYCGV